MVPEQSWHDAHYLETHGAIRAAASELRRRGERVTKKAVAAVAGVDPRTVGRHFDNPAAVLGLGIDKEPMERYLELIRARPAHEDSLKAMLRAGIEHCAERENDDAVVGLAAGLLIPENWLVAMDAIQRDWYADLVTAVAERGGRNGVPDASDHMAVAMTITASLGVLRSWAESGFERRMEDIWRDVVESWGVCPDGLN